MSIGIDDRREQLHADVLTRLQKKKVALIRPTVSRSSNCIDAKFDQKCDLIFFPPELHSSIASNTGEAWATVIDLEAWGLSEQADWLEDAIAATGRLSDLPHNWDSYDADSISTRAIQSAIDLLRDVAISPHISAPFVTPTRDGHVGLVWDNARQRLEVEVCPDGALEFLYLDQCDPSQDADSTTDDISGIAEYLRYF